MRGESGSVAGVSSFSILRWCAPSSSCFVILFQFVFRYDCISFFPAAIPPDKNL